MPDTEPVLKPFLVSSAPCSDMYPHVFVDLMGGFLVEKLFWFFPAAAFIRVLSICNLYDSFQFTLQLHRTIFDSCGRNYLLSKRLHITVCSSPFSPKFLCSLYCAFWCKFPLLFLIFLAGEGKAASSCSQIQHARGLWTPKFRLQGPLVPSSICLTKK